MTIKTIKQIRQGLEKFRLASTDREIISILEAQADVDVNTDPGKQVIELGPGTSNEETFVNVTGANSRIITRERMLRLPKLVGASASDNINMSVAEFLRRPRVMATGSLTATDTASTFSSQDVLQGLLSTEVIPKLKGVFAIRATTVVTLQVNANRFQQGIYILAYMPTGGMDQGSAEFVKFATMHRYSKSQITQLMHLKLDVACDTEVQLRIPYVSALAASPLKLSGTTVKGSPGIWFMYPYVQLASVAGSTTASYTVWTHFEDVELLGNTVSQVGWEAQSGRSTRKGKDLLKQETDSNRPLSNGLKLAADISDKLSVIPLLSSIATPLSWVLEATSRAAYYWGWSKPLLIENPCRMVREPAPFMGNCDGPDYSLPLSNSMENRVGILPGFGGTDEDEMAIDFLKKKFVWTESFTYNTSHTAGTVLLIKYNAPQYSNPTISDGFNDIKCPTTIAYLSLLYNYWRGSILYKFKLAKTEFHSGRLEIRFVPYTDDNGGYPSYNVNQSEYTLREIWDVRESSELTISVPYVSVFPWQTTDTTGRTGVIEVLVRDPLIAPGTVPSSIICNIEIAGGDDLAFAVPNTRNVQIPLPIAPLSYQCGWDAQVGEDFCAVESRVIGDAVCESRDLAYEEISIGEAAISLRQLVKRGGFMRAYNPPVVNNIIADDRSTIMLCPSIIRCYRSDALGTISNPTEDPMSYIGCLYAQSRGGIRLKFIHDANSNVSNIYTTLLNASSAFSDNFTDYYVNNNEYPQQCFQELKAGITVHSPMAIIPSIQIPQYTTTINRIVGANQQYDGITFHTKGNYSDHNIVRYIWSNPKQVVTTDDWQAKIFIWRSGADDFNFGDFVSIPALAFDQSHVP